jgi:glycosyltransferase involved in cell wall biosynthesis
MTSPFISVIIPCRNEELYISKCLDSLISNNYPKEKTEVFVIDGSSTDSTSDIARDYIRRYPFITLISNPKKVFPAAVNIGIKESKGDFIFIIGAHAVYEPDYFSKCVGNSLKNNADNVGGVLETAPINDDLVGSLISFVLSNSFGVGNSRFRTGSDDIIEVDTVFGGCYKREVFQKYGLFIESLTSSSDYEFNKRIKQQGAKILLIPDIKVTYYTRSTFQEFIKNNLRNGFWAIYPIAITNKIPLSLRHFIPLVFVMSIGFLLILSLKWILFIKVLLALIIIYLLTSLYFSIRSTNIKYYQILFMPFMFLVLHFSYGLGSLWGAIRVIFFYLKNPKANPGQI